MKTTKNHSKLYFALTILACMLFSTAQLRAQSDRDTALSNKKIIEKGFDEWAKGTGNLFPLVVEDVKWTIEGYTQDEYVSSPKVYTSKKQLMETTMVQLYAKLDGIIKPELTGVYADGDMVIASWKGYAKTTDGKPFANTYAWFMKMKDGKITELTAFLNMAVMQNVLSNVPDKK